MTRKFKIKKTMPTDITDNVAQEQSNLELYTVTFTKIVTIESQMQKHQIDVLLKDPSVKSINIKK